MTDQESKSLLEIKNLISDIKNTYSTQHTAIYSEIKDMYHNLSQTTNQLKNEKNELTTAFMNEQQINNRLLNDRNELINVITQETSELQQFESENEELAREIKKMQAIITKNKYIVNELENECDLLNKKIDFQEQKRMNKENNYKDIADKYRNALQFDILPVKQNVLKIILKNSYFIIDFNNSQAIVDCFPLIMSLERLNDIYREKDGIYEFVKWIRKEFIKWE